MKMCYSLQTEKIAVVQGQIKKDSNKLDWTVKVKKKSRKED